MSSKSSNIYEINGVIYDENVPYEWSSNHESQLAPYEAKIGPELCQQCKECFINGVFVHYCYQCAHFFPERHTPIPISILQNISEEILWKYVPYMCGTRIQTIGIKQKKQSADENEDQYEEDDDDEILETLILKQKLLWHKNEQYETILTKYKADSLYTNDYDYDGKSVTAETETEERVQSDYHKMFGIVYTYGLQKNMGTPAEINRTIDQKDNCLRHMLMVKNV